MSQNALETLLPNRQDGPYQLVYRVDITNGANSGAIGVHELHRVLPAYHDVINVDFRVVAACVGTSGTISFGVDDDSEPDDLLDDTNVSSLTLDARVAGIPTIGTDATAIEVTTADKAINYEIKTTAFTAGIIDMIVTLLPTK